MRTSVLKGVLFTSLLAAAGMGAMADAGSSADDLIHRWSFNGSLADSVGGLTATLGGTAKYNDATNGVRCTGTANNTSYIALGTGLVPSTSTPVTFEIWATQNSVKNWSRIFDFGSNNQNYLLMTWTQNTTAASDCVELKVGNTSLIRTLNTMQPYTVGTEFHIAMRLTPQTSGKTLIEWAKRDVTTGAVLASGSATTSAAWDPSALAAYANCWLGRSEYSSDYDADATYNEVRVWKAALTDEQLTWSAQLGPDQLPTAAVLPDLTRTLVLTDCTNGTVSVNGAVAVGASTQTVSAAYATSLQAIPEEGYVFCRWTGDTQYITSGSATSTNITVSTAHNITLAAVFDAEKPVYARYVDGALTYLTAKKGVTEAPADGMTNTIAVVFSSDAEYQALAASYTNEVAKSKGLELEANVKLTADADWTALDYSLGGYSVDLNGKHLTTGSLAGTGGYTSDGNMVANGTFEANTVASGARVQMTPNGWRTGGTVALIKNYATHGYANQNSSTWCDINNGGYIYREFTVVQEGTYTLWFNVASHNTSGVWWNSSVYAGFDGSYPINGNGIGWWTTSRSCSVNLSVGTHTLRIGCNGNSGVIVDNVSLYKSSSATQTGILEVNVPEGKTLTDGSVLFGGGNALQVWKSGKGTLQMTKTNNGFGSSNGYVSMIVKDGILQKKEPSAGTATCGPQYCTIQVDDGGTIDVNGRSYWDYNYILNGAGYDGLGALRNTGAVSDPWTNGSYGYVRNVSIGSDTLIKGSQSFAMSFWQYNATTMTLNGHTVHYGGPVIYFGNMSYSGTGTVVIDEGCTMESYVSSPTLAGCTLQVDGQLQQHDVALGTISNLIFTATGKFNNPWTTRPAYTVLHTYAPNLTAASSSKVTHPTLTLGTAASLYTTLDLSRFTEAFDATTTTFYANTIVTVELGDRELADQQKLVSWTTVPSVTSWIGSGTNLGNLSLKAKEDGLYLVAAPAWAEWDVANDCWKFFRADGSAYTDTWEDGVTSDIDVHFASLAEFEAIKAQAVTPASYLLTKLELTPGSTLYDFTTGFNFAIAPNMVIDLHGNRLKLPSANIGGAVPFTVTDTSEYVTNGSFESFTGTLGNSGNWNYLSSSVTLNNWTGPTNAGITKNSGTWINSAVPAGTYACFMQCNSYIQQTITAPGDGTYRLSFSYAERPKYTGATLYVMIDDQEVKTITGITATTFTACTVDLALTAGTHTLKFGTRLVNSTDQGTAIDNVKLCKIGELIVDVADGVSIANSQVAITGNARVTKTGAGAFTASRASQSYASGTEIVDGLCTIGNASCFGASGTEVQVDTNATLEVNAVGGLNAYTFVLAGGTMQNTKADVGEGNHQLLKMRLTADSTFKPTCSYGFIGPSYAATTLDLAGHKLTVPVGGGKYFWLFNTTVTTGTVDITSGGWLKVDKTAVNAGSTTFRINSALNIVAPFTVGGYEAIYGGAAYNAGTGVMTVNNLFKPANACYRGVTLKDGVTMDLSQFSGVLTGTSSFTAGPNTLTYPTNATLQVELHGRALTGSKIIGWDVDAGPTNVTFVATKQTHDDGRMLVEKDDGVYVVGGSVIFFR